MIASDFNLQLKNNCDTIIKRNNIGFSYKLDTLVLSRHNLVRHLSVTFDSKFAFNIHIGNLSDNCFIALGFIITTLRDFNNFNGTKLLGCAAII